MLVRFHRLRGAAWQNFVIHSEFIFKLQTIFHILIKGKNALVQFLNVSKATHSRCYLMAFFSLHWNWVLWAGTTIGVLEFFHLVFRQDLCSSFLSPYKWCRRVSKVKRSYRVIKNEWNTCKYINILFTRTSTCFMQQNPDINTVTA